MVPGAGGAARSSLDALLAAVRRRERVSRKEQVEGHSPGPQLPACEQLCERRGYEIVARFSDEGSALDQSVQESQEKPTPPPQRAGVST